MPDETFRYTTSSSPRAAPNEHLAEPAEVRVVVDLDVDAEAGRQLLRGLDALPPRQDRRADRAGPAIDRPRHAHARADELLVLDPRLVQQVVEQGGRRVERRRRVVVDVELQLALAEHGRGQVGQREPQVPVVEGDADRRARRRG